MSSPESVKTVRSCVIIAQWALSLKWKIMLLPQRLRHLSELTVEARH